RAMSDSSSDSLIAVGGVACNERLQEMLKQMCEDRFAEVGCMDDRYCVDNGIMIAYTGWLMYNASSDKSIYNVHEIDVDQRFRTDQVLITWRD
ncbi:MAG: hypothetical protein MHPSP_002764, partial [Paramarteilia canceri]